MEIAFNRILVGFDNSQSARIALEKAVDAAERFNSKVYAIYVNKSRDKIAKVREAVRSIGESRKIEIDFIEKQGKVYKEINIMERELGIDLIVLGTHGNEGWQPFWIGSNAYRVVSASNCPVITIQESASVSLLEDIMLPMDDSDETRQKVPYACAVASAFGARVHIYGVSGRKSGPTESRINAYVRQTADFMHERGVRTSEKIELGVKSLPTAVLDYSKEVRAGLVVMMTETESAGVIMGSYAQHIINNSVVPVMSIHSRDLRVAGAVGY